MSARPWIRGLSLTLAFLPFQLAQKNSVPEWEDPSIFERNQEETHVFLVPYVSLPQALDDARDASPYYRSLNGQWKFQWSINPAEAPENFFAPGFDTTGWPEIRVPSNWQMEGFGWPLFRNIAHPAVYVPVERYCRRQVLTIDLVDESRREDFYCEFFD